ncbi:MAG: hypothetical protein D6734_00385 [Candidatus Schekmanbacteria bacterium]|nr:MAG: hypothetical protein D6734_00385 [Candidatus Schekmanbacteria bacterium]
MKIARFRGFEEGFVIEEKPRPAPSDDEVLIRVKCVAVSGTDVYRFRKYDNPTVMPFKDGDTPGHEAVGIVEEVGRKVKSLKEGERVVVQPFWGCGKCDNCKKGRENFCPSIQAFGFHIPGVFSEYIVAREDIALNFNDEIDFEEALPTHHMAVNLYGLKSSGIDLQSVNTAAVFGTGNLGLLMVMQLKALGIPKIFAVDIDESRLAIAKKLAGSVTINASISKPDEEIRRQTDGIGTDIAIELAGGNAPTLDPALDSLRKGGTYIALAVRGMEDGLNFRKILSKSLRVQGSSTHTIKEMKDCLQMIEQRSVDTKEIITHRFKFDEINDAFNCRADDPTSLYVVVDI